MVTGDTTRTPSQAFVDLIDKLHQLMKSAHLKPAGMFTNSVCKRRLITQLIRDPHHDERGLYHLETKDGRYAELVRNDGILLVKNHHNTKTDPIVLPEEIDRAAVEIDYHGTKAALYPLGDANTDCERVLAWLDREGQSYHDADEEIELWQRRQQRINELVEEINGLQSGGGSSGIIEIDDTLTASAVDELEQDLQHEIARLESQLST